MKKYKENILNTFAKRFFEAQKDLYDFFKDSDSEITVKDIYNTIDNSKTNKNETKD